MSVVIRQKSFTVLSFIFSVYFSRVAGLVTGCPLFCVFVSVKLSLEKDKYVIILL